MKPLQIFVARTHLRCSKPDESQQRNQNANCVEVFAPPSPGSAPWVCPTRLTRLEAGLAGPKASSIRGFLGIFFGAPTRVISKAHRVPPTMGSSRDPGGGRWALIAESKPTRGLFGARNPATHPPTDPPTHNRPHHMGVYKW